MCVNSKNYTLSGLCALKIRCVIQTNPLKKIGKLELILPLQVIYEYALLLMNTKLALRCWWYLLAFEKSNNKNKQTVREK